MVLIVETKEEKAVYSIGISSFLEYIRECNQNYRIAITEEQEANDATQDILHSIELEKNDYHSYAHLAIRLKEVRANRRDAKDIQIQLEPIVEWAEQNQNTIKSIERLLGDVRKAERKTENRIYTPRTEEINKTKKKKCS